MSLQAARSVPGTPKSAATSAEGFCASAGCVVTAAGTAARFTAGTRTRGGRLTGTAVAGALARSAPPCGRRARAGAVCRGRARRLRALELRTLELRPDRAGRRGAACRDEAVVPLGRLLRLGAGAASFCARRTRFQALRAAAECLRARFASRLASLRRLRARFSSSFAMRTRCFATSACSRALSRGSAGRLAVSLPLFFIFVPARRAASLTQSPCRFHRRQLSTEFVHNHVDRAHVARQTMSRGKGLRRGG